MKKNGLHNIGRCSLTRAHVVVNHAHLARVVVGRYPRHSCFHLVECCCAGLRFWCNTTTKPGESELHSISTSGKQRTVQDSTAATRYRGVP